MRRAAVALLLASLAACSKAPEDGAGVPDIGGNASAGLSFTYAYDFILPTRAIADLQEAHAAACERLGVARCRITGLRYDVGRSGEVGASLSIDLAAPIARAFGSEATAVATRAGAAVSGVSIGGAAMAPTAEAGDRLASVARDDRERIDRQLARSDLPPAERAELLRQRAASVEEARAATGAATDARQQIATTPMRFAYVSGRGTGFVNRLADTLDTALASSACVITGVIWLLAALGPPALALLLLLVGWRRWGRQLWVRLLGDTTVAP